METNKGVPMSKLPKNTILELTIAQFGAMQNPPLEENTLRLILGFTKEHKVTKRSHNYSIEELNKISESVRRAGSVFSDEQRQKFQDDFLEKIALENAKIYITTINEVINGWFYNVDSYSKNEDHNYRFFQKIYIMKPLVIGLQNLGYPEEDISRLKESADYVAAWRKPTRDTSKDIGP